MLFRFFIVLFFSLFSLQAFAYDTYTTFNIKVINKTNSDAVITLGSEQEDWECRDFCIQQIVPANTKRKFVTGTNTFRNFFKASTALETLNVSYGNTNAKIQFWANHVHSVDENVKTAIIYVRTYRGLGDYYYTLVSMAGVGSDSDKILTDLYIENLYGNTGTANVTLTFTE